MIGVKKNNEANGFDVAGFRRRSICVRDHRNPEEKEAVINKENPKRLNAVSPATIITTPTVITAMMANSFQDGFSNLNIKANKSTKPSTEDLHIAVCAVSLLNQGMTYVLHSLKNVNVMNFRLMLPNPMSILVAAPHGAIRVR